MKKISTFFKKQRMLLSLLAVAFAANANAASSYWYACNVQVDAYPTGAGEVYITEDYNDVPDDNAYSESKTLEFVKLSFQSFYAFAKPAEGWQVIGAVKDTLDANGDWAELDELTHLKYADQDYLSLSASDAPYFTDATGNPVDSITTANNMPLDPTDRFRVIFTHVAVDEYDNQDALGTASISKLANDLGDKVTLTATPKDERCHFVKWTLDGKDVSTEPSIEVEVTGIANYYAHFTADSAEVLHFAEEGEYKFWCDDKYNISVPSNMVYMLPDVDSVYVDDSGDYKVGSVGYGYSIYCNTPTILYGKGDVQIVKTPSTYSGSTSLLLWSGAEGTKLDTLDVTNRYYTFDLESAVFTLANTEIPANQTFLGVPDSVFTNAGTGVPETILFNNSSNIATAIENVQAPALKQAAAKQGIYDLQGRRVDAINREGIYIFDGKKVIYRKK